MKKNVKKNKEWIKVLEKINDYLKFVIWFGSRPTCLFPRLYSHPELHHMGIICEQRNCNPLGQNRY